jgi:hypothetical protein
VAAFTMTTVLLLGLLSAAAIGATRAVVGAPAEDDAALAAAAEADAEPGDATTGDARSPASRSKPKSQRAGTSAKPPTKSASARKGEARRAGGAVSPSDALDRAGEP